MPVQLFSFNILGHIIEQLVDSGEFQVSSRTTMYYEDKQYAFFESAIEASVPGDCSLSYTFVHSRLREKMLSITV